jgi:arylsulfatase A-like enzyme
MDFQERLVKEVEKTTVESGARDATSAQLACPDCNVVIITLPTLRQDRIGLYAPERDLTPHIDDFFKDSLVFTNTLAPTGWTAPNAVSFLTALFPHAHGIVVREPASSLVLYNSAIKTLAQLLSANGYHTAAFTGGGDYNRFYNGLDRGFDFYLDEVNYDDTITDSLLSLGGPGVSLSYAPMRFFLESATEWLKENADERFFLFVQGYDTHCPLDPHEPYARQFTAGLTSDVDFSYCHWTYEDTAPVYKDGVPYWETQVLTRNGTIETIVLSEEDVAYMNALYDARVAEVDDYLQGLFGEFERLGLSENTIVILTAEHGEMLGEHGWFMRGGTRRGTTYEQALNFPLVIKHPHVNETIQVNDIVQLVDVMPTLLSMLAINDPQSLLRDGSVLNFSAFGDEPTNAYGYAGAIYIPIAKNARNAGAMVNIPEVVRHGDWKFVKETLLESDGLGVGTTSFKLFNLAEDPDETTNLFEQETTVARDLQEKLEEWSQRYYSPLQ